MRNIWQGFYVHINFNYQQKAKNENLKIWK
jgi:hypothetical protein